MRHSSGMNIGPSAATGLTPTAWNTTVQTWRPGLAELFVNGRPVASLVVNSASEFAVARFGWGFATDQDFNGDFALAIACKSAWTPAMVARWHADTFGFLRPWAEHPGLLSTGGGGSPVAVRRPVVIVAAG